MPVTNEDGVGIVSKVGSAPLFARKNLPSLDDVPCSNLASVIASSAISVVPTAFGPIFGFVTASSAILAVVTESFSKLFLAVLAAIAEFIELANLSSVTASS
mgnify:CR=1 FL=1